MGTKSQNGCFNGRFNAKVGNFFTDFYGSQGSENKEETVYKVPGKWKIQRLCRHFKSNVKESLGVKCIIYLKHLHQLFRPYLSKLTLLNDETLDDITNLVLYNAIRDVKTNPKESAKGILKKLPRKELEIALNELRFLCDNIPDRGFFAKCQMSTKLPTKSTNLSEKLRVDPVASIFRIPMIDQVSSDEEIGDFSLAIDNNGKFPIGARYNHYKEQMKEFPYDEFKEIVVVALTSEKSDEELLNYFLDAFGCEIFEFLNEIIRNRKREFDWLEIDSSVNRVGDSRVTSSSSRPALGSQVTVQSENEKNYAKTLRKIEKKSKKGPQSDELINDMEQDLNYLRHQPIFKRGVDAQIDYPHVHDQLRTISVSTKFNGMLLKHPENTVKKETSSLVEFTIPGASRPANDQLESVKISSLDATGRMVFKDVKELNRVQSEVFPVAYNTNENLLICAPTGAGKTNIALLAIVHQIKSHTSNGLVRRDDFKIVYVCPMKALATEMVANFSKRLAPIGITVKEVTGDMHLTKKEIAETQMLVTTPEKWDVISRKGAVDSEVTSLVKLLILDEVHLLNSDRGPVIEALVARTLRQVVSSQSVIRIVALSATLPGYLDVANFLKVNPRSGLFFFDNRFRSVPLTMTFLGVKAKNDNDTLDRICYEKIAPIVKDGHQVMVFVTSRNMTSLVAKNLLELVKAHGSISQFSVDRSIHRLRAKFKSSDLESLVPNGFGCHHAGMCRPDRLEVEALFRCGALKVIVCTTTLAWGVNLPAHAVIIRGTSRYDAQKSSFVDMDMLDVMQIFGRAGRPQFDSSGHGIIMTSVNNMTNYMTLLTSQVPIESQFLSFVPDNLNAEIVLGTVSNMKEAMEWLSNTFVYCRIKKNPLVYGLTLTDIWEPERLFQFFERKLYEAATILESAQMIRFDSDLGELRPTNYGRIASFYYISHQTMKFFHDCFGSSMTVGEIVLLISKASEFRHIQVRNDELVELDRLQDYCEISFDLDNSSVPFKVITLIQANIFRARITVTSLISDCEFIMQSVTRLARALFEIAVDKNYGTQVNQCLLVAQMVEQRVWYERNALLQFKELEVKGELLDKFPLDDWMEMSDREMLDFLRSRHFVDRVRHCCRCFPRVTLDVTVKPITDGVVRLQLLIGAGFAWDNSIHGNVQHYYVWVEDPSRDNICHFESFVLNKRQVVTKEDVELIFTVPLAKPHSSEYYVVVANSKYMHATTFFRLDLDKLTTFPSQTIVTRFLCVRPLPKSVLHNELYESLYGFTHYNAIQSQVFHCCYNTDCNILLGAPTGSGKTIVSEICMLRLFTRQPKHKVVYIAPMKALVRERVKDWSSKFAKLGLNVVEVTGDVTPQSSLISGAHIIITTPEKWDGMSRNWLKKDFVKNVALVIIDEIHLLAEERGPVLEVIVSRMNFINSMCQNNDKVRIVGLSTAMANAGDLANWLGIDKKGLFNFSSSVRPVPLEIHLKGFTAKNYCPRMATMNRPAYQAICQYAPQSPTLIFVSSRKQTRITSYDLIKCLLSDTDPKQWLHSSQDEIEAIRSTVSDSDLGYLLLFGIGIHHAGLQEKDRQIVEELFVNQRIQVLVATATLAWGVNFPAHLVIVKGTEYYDGATKRYVDMPVTDVLQMMGRAGRPQYDTSGVACVFVQENKKNFYRKFLFEPFPVESDLLRVLPEHVNAEIANGTVTCRNQLIDLVCSTFFFRRLLVNPTYYKMEDVNNPNVYLNELARSVCADLEKLQCITIDNEGIQEFYNSTYLGQLAAKYYLSCKTMLYMETNVSENSSLDELIVNISQVEEYALFPVRHNEDKINKHLVQELGVRTNNAYDSPHLKVVLLIKCYLLDKQMPNQEYVVDLKSVFDQIIRIIQAMISLVSYKSWLDCTLKLIRLNQMLIQGMMAASTTNLIMLPHVDSSEVACRIRKRISGEFNVSSDFDVISLISLRKQNKQSVDGIIKSVLGDDKKSNEFLKVLSQFPVLRVDFAVNDDSIKVGLDSSDQSLSLSVDCDVSVIFEFTIRREGPYNSKVFSKKFGKQKDESWFFVLASSNDLVIMQRFTLRKSKSIDVRVQLPKERGVYKYFAYFLSDSYIGLDQKIAIKVKVGNDD